MQSKNLLWHTYGVNSKTFFRHHSGSRAEETKTRNENENSWAPHFQTTLIYKTDSLALLSEFDGKTC